MAGKRRSLAFWVAATIVIGYGISTILPTTGAAASGIRLSSNGLGTTPDATSSSDYAIAWVVKPTSASAYGTWSGVTGVSFSGEDLYISGYVLVGFVHGGAGESGRFARLYPNGTIQWEIAPNAIGYTVSTEVTGIATSSSAVYIAGMTNGVFSGQTSAGQDDAFVQKYDLLGNLQWTRQFGTSYSDRASGVAVDATSVYVSGATPGALPNQTSLGGPDAFLQKYDLDGNFQWTRQFGTYAEDDARALATDRSGVYVAGATQAALAGQPFAGLVDGYLRKYDASGSLLWTREFGSTQWDDATGVATSNSGVYVVGLTTGGLPGQTTIGGSDGYLRKYTADGTTLWSRAVGTIASDRLSAVAADDSGPVVVGVTHGSFPGRTNAGSADEIVVRYDPNGTLVWQNQIGTWTLDIPYGVALGPGEVIVGGYTNGTFPCTHLFHPDYFPFGTGEVPLADGLLAAFVPAVTSTQPTSGSAPTVAPVIVSPAGPIPGQEMTFMSSVADADDNLVEVTWAFCNGARPTQSTPPGGSSVILTDTFLGPGSGTYPVTITADDGRGGTTVFRTAILLLEPALLRVFTNPAVPGKIRMDGRPMDEWGLNWVKIPPGNHTVSFGDVYGYTRPPTVMVTTFSATTATVRGDYFATGWLRVVTNPPIASTISVDGVPRDDWGMWESMPPGTYTVSFGPVAGYQPPGPQSVTVYAGETSQVSGTFTVDPKAKGPTGRYGLLRVTTDPPVPAKVFVDGVARDEWGLNWLKLPVGSFVISFSDVYGATAPAPATVQITDGQTTAYVGHFLVHGSLRVVTSPALPATIFVDNLPSNDWGMWQSMPPGTYRVLFGFVPGYTTPPPQTVAVSAGNLTMVTAAYPAAAFVTMYAAPGVVKPAFLGPADALAAADPLEARRPESRHR